MRVHSLARPAPFFLVAAVVCIAIAGDEPRRSGKSQGRPIPAGAIKVPLPGSLLGTEKIAR